MRDFTTIKDAEIFRQECIRLGTKDAWITAIYNGNRMLLQELIAGIPQSGFQKNIQSMLILQDNHSFRWE